MTETISDIVYNHLRRKIMARAETPSAIEIASALAAAGYADITPSQVSHASRHLAQCGRLLKTGSSSSNDIVWALPVGPCRTKPRCVRINRERAEADRLKRETAAAASRTGCAGYDAAVARREFGWPEHQSGEKPEPFQRVRAPYGAHSLTGNSADMAAAA